MAAPVVPLFPGSGAGGGRRRQRSTPPLPPAAKSLFEQARNGLSEAEAAAEPAGRYAAAHLAALRAAAAVVAVRAHPDKRRRQPQPVWALLAGVCPELREWAAFFAACSRTRAAVQAGVTRLVSARDADDLVRQCAQFIELAERAAAGSRR